MTAVCRRAVLNSQSAQPAFPFIALL